MKRPPNQDVERIFALMPQTLLKRIDAFRSAGRLPSRAEAIRQLVEAGLEAAPPERDKKRRS